MRVLCLLFCLGIASAAQAQELPHLAIMDTVEVEAEAETEAEPAGETTPESPAAPEAERPDIVMEKAPEGFYDVAVLQGLNKVTARISQLEVPVGTTERFGNLEVVVQNCWRSSQNDRPENAALMEIYDRKPNEAAKLAFKGWMFSSSPSLAGLEHPVYDIIILECQRRKLGSGN